MRSKRLLAHTHGPNRPLESQSCAPSVPSMQAHASLRPGTHRGSGFVPESAVPESVAPGCVSPASSASGSAGPASSTRRSPPPASPVPPLVAPASRTLRTCAPSPPPPAPLADDPWPALPAACLATPAAAPGSGLLGAPAPSGSCVPKQPAPTPTSDASASHKTPRTSTNRNCATVPMNLPVLLFPRHRQAGHLELCRGVPPGFMAAIEQDSGQMSAQVTVVSRPPSPRCEAALRATARIPPPPRNRSRCTRGS